jgi:hypothetical protein
MFLTAWLLFPLVLLALSAGAGLLVRHLAGGAVPAVLLVPVGFATVVVVSVALTWSEPTAPLAPAALVVAAAAGFVLTRRELRALPRPGARFWWPAAATLAAFVAVGAPVLFSGEPTWTGYTHSVDIGHEFDISRYLADHGRAEPAPIRSSYEGVAAKLLETRYPAGTQSPLGAAADLIGTDLAWLYQPFVAFMVAMAALALYGLLEGLITPRPFRALAGAVAAQPNLLFGWALTGGNKEVGTVAMLVLIAALLRRSPPSVSQPRALVPLAIAITAGFASFTLAIAPWLGILLPAVFVLDLLRSGKRVRTAAAWARLGGLTALLSLPTLLPSLDLFRSTADAGGSVDLGLGNLAQPLPVWPTFGVWLTEDYRYPLDRTTLTYLAIAVVIALVAIGVGWAIRRRETAVLALGLAGAIATVYGVARTGAWIELKIFAITSTIVLALAFAGIGALLRRPLTLLLGLQAALLLVGAVVFGNVLVYHNVTLAPRDRMADLERLGNAFAGRGPALYPAFEEYAEYFLRRADATSLVNPAAGTLGLRPGLELPPGIQYGFDLDDYALDYVQSFPLIVRRRHPTDSRPPSNWELAKRTRFHEVWRRRDPGAEILSHVPFDGTRGERSSGTCARIDARAREAGRGARIAYALRAENSQFAPALAPFRAAPSWSPEGPAFATFGPGRVGGKLAVPAPGRYEAWLSGNFGRAVHVDLDGSRLGSVAYQANYPGQFEYLGERSLAPGAHQVDVIRDGGDLRPGNGDEVGNRRLGLLILVREDRNALRVTVRPASEARRVCRGDMPLDWIEVLRPA